MTVDPMALTRCMMALSEDDKLVALAWIERVVKTDPNDPENLSAGMLMNILEGYATITGVNAEGELMFALTEVGKAHADEVVANSPEAQRMIAALLDATRVDGPKRTQ